MATLFVNKFEASKLVENEQLTLKPTSRNGTQGEAGIAKGLDWFLLSESLFRPFGSCRSWISMDKTSNHQQVFVQLENNKDYKLVPFKFNHKWLEEEDIRNSFSCSCHWFSRERGLILINQFLDNLRVIKRKVVIWERQCKKKDIENLTSNWKSDWGNS